MHAANRPRGVLLDALGTLLALQPPAPLLRGELARRFGLEITLSEAERAIAAEIAYYRQHLDEGRDQASLAGLRRRCAASLRDALPDGDRDGRGLDLDELTDALLASLRFTAFDDVRPALSAARQAGRRLVVVSNWDVSLVGVLQRLELAPLVDGVLTSAGAGVRKPSPAIFRQALQLAGVEAQDAIHIGDSFEEDVTGARNAGVQPILLSRDRRPGPPGIPTIASLRELGWREP